MLKLGSNASVKTFYGLKDLWDWAFETAGEMALMVTGAKRGEVELDGFRGHHYRGFRCEDESWCVVI